jgi:hypothetical protein
MSVFLFCMSNVILPLVLLNLVIAQIGGTYEHTKKRETILLWKGKADLVIEAETTNRSVYNTVGWLWDLGSDKCVYGDGPGQKDEWIHVLKPSQPVWEAEAEPTMADVSRRMAALEAVVGHQSATLEAHSRRARRRGDDQTAQLDIIQKRQEVLAKTQGVQFEAETLHGESVAAPREPEELAGENRRSLLATSTTEHSPRHSRLIDHSRTAHPSLRSPQPQQQQPAGRALQDVTRSRAEYAQ